MAFTVTRPGSLRLTVESGMIVLAGSLLLVLSARIAVPFWPVPMTMQPLALLLVAGFAGPQLGSAAVAAYLLEGAVGLPVFAGTPEHGIGLAYLAGPTGGYLVALLPAAWVAGVAAAHLRSRPVALLAALVGAIAVIYLGGVAWLARFVGLGGAVRLGALPFLLGDLVKAAVATATLVATRRFRRA